MNDGPAPDDSARPQPASDAGRPYHHGDLRSALIAAAEAELAVSGLEGFTLRACARRAGVSHAAPAHHFGDVHGLLGAVATLGFERLAASMRLASEGIALDDPAYMVAIGRGYVDFALAHPAQFRLIFRGDRIRKDTATAEAGGGAFGMLVAAVGGLRGVVNPLEHQATRDDVYGFWSLAHGLADLAISGRLGDCTPETASDMAAAILARFVARDGSDGPDVRPA